jgi:myo-inositol-1(or 4)-monophosphatase
MSTPATIDTKDPGHLALLLDVASDAALQAGALIRKGITDDLHVTFKEQGKHNLVTIMDTASEALIKKVIGERLEGARFLAEESGGNHDLTPLTWVVDPIDGTVNYAHGIPIYCVSIAAVADNEPVVGVIYAPETNELFTATRGGGAFLNGEPLRVSQTDDIERAILVTGFPYNVAENPYGCIDAFAAFLGLGIPIRRLGSAALDLAYVAAGRFDGFWEVALNEWDVAAGGLMVAEAGGRMGTYAPDAPERTLTIDRMLATNGRIHEAMLKVLVRE